MLIDATTDHFLCHSQLWQNNLLYEVFWVKLRKLGGLEESLGMLAALSDMVNDVRLPSQQVKSDEPLKKENHERCPLMYNLCVIKIGMEILRLKLNEMDDLTDSQFSKIDAAILEMSDEILELRERRESMVN